ncbi:Uma2 family endonuclease [Botrimarina sp.]|uniref:Uma2 family endonuclease n=1 Tax=Botrimarina sp. TaxID=2795802 RepID=UPI0032ED8FD8
MTAAEQLPLLTVDEYLPMELAAETRHEYIGGYVHAMAGANNLHNRVAGNVLITLGSQLTGKPCEAFNSDTKVRIRTIGATRFYYPDAMVVCEPNSDDAVFQDRPVVIVEVLSETTRRTDETEKRDAYLTIPSLAAYLLVETERPAVAVYRRRSEGAGVDSFEAQLYQGAGAVVPLPEIEAELALEAVYRRVTFSEKPADPSAG